jgi:hypothetical protein
MEVASVSKAFMELEPDLGTSLFLKLKSKLELCYKAKLICKFRLLGHQVFLFAIFYVDRNFFFASFRVGCTSYLGGHI